MSFGFVLVRVRVLITQQNDHPGSLPILKRTAVQLYELQEYKYSSTDISKNDEGFNI